MLLQVVASMTSSTSSPFSSAGVHIYCVCGGGLYFRSVQRWNPVRAQRVPHPGVYGVAYGASTLVCSVSV